MTSGRSCWPAQWIGGAAAEVLARAERGVQDGVVVGEFRHGHYVRFGQTIFAIGQPAIHPGPLHVLFRGPKPQLEAGTIVSCDRDAIHAPGLVIDLRGATRWEPKHRTFTANGPGLSTLAHLCSTTAAPPGLDLDWAEVQHAADRADLDALSELLAGRGPGLTPSGDDVLAGILLMRAIVGSEGDCGAAVAEAAPTTDLSRAFLRWAARGHSIEPVHRLVEDAERGRTASAEQNAAIVKTIGSSSGAALLAGIGLVAQRPGPCFLSDTTHGLADNMIGEEVRGRDDQTQR